MRFYICCCFEHVISVLSDVMTLIFLFHDIINSQRGNLQFGFGNVIFALTAWNLVWMALCLGWRPVSSGQDSAVKAPSLLLALMCRPFKPAQQMLEIELAVRFLESVLPEKMKKKKRSCLTAISYHCTWSLKRGIWDFQGNLFGG